MDCYGHTLAYMSARRRAHRIPVFGFLDRFFDTADHVERLLRQVIVVAVENALEASDGVPSGKRTCPANR